MSEKRSLLRAKDQVVLIKKELTYGIDSTPSHANAVQFSKIEINATIEKEQRENVNGRLGHQGAFTVGEKIEITGTVYLTGSGVAGNAPNYGLLLEMCAHAVEVKEGLSVTYTPTDVDLASGTVYWRSGAVQHKATGVRGSVEFTLDPKKVPVANFKLEGIYSDPELVDAPISGVDFTVIENPIAINFKSSSLIFFNEVNPIAYSLSFNPGIAMSYRDLIGYQGVDLTDRKGDIKIKLETTDRGYIETLARAKNNDYGNFAFEFGSEAGSMIRFEAEQIQLSDSPKLAYENDIGVFDLTAAIVPKDRNTDYSITFS